jgi:hypothetical protein
MSLGVLCIFAKSGYFDLTDNADIPLLSSSNFSMLAGIVLFSVISIMGNCNS